MYWRFLYNWTFHWQNTLSPKLTLFTAWLVFQLLRFGLNLFNLSDQSNRRITSYFLGCEFHHCNWMRKKKSETPWWNFMGHIWRNIVQNSGIQYIDLSAPWKWIILSWSMCHFTSSLCPYSDVVIKWWQDVTHYVEKLAYHQYPAGAIYCILNWTQLRIWPLGLPIDIISYYIY